MKDPVCNMDINDISKAPKSVYQGQTYSFCSKTCKDQFDREPGKYVAKQAGVDVRT